MLKKYLPTLIDGNKYEDPEAVNGYFKLKSLRKYTWTDPKSKTDPSYIRYDYHLEVEFHGVVSLWGRTYTEQNFKYLQAYRKKNIQRQLKYMANSLIKDYIRVIDASIPIHYVDIKKVIIKTKEA
jgi:hypothetical protein